MDHAIAIYRRADAALFSGLPSSTRSIIIVEFMERYAYYAFRSVLVSFFVDKLLMEESSAISAFMYTSALAYFTPLIGGLLSDAKLGKYTTIVVFSTVYIGGLTALAFGAFADEKSIAFLGLFFIGVGTGGIKPCVSSFGADQLKYTCDSSGNVSALPSSSSEVRMRSCKLECNSNLICLHEFERNSNSSTSFSCDSLRSSPRTP